jgi:Family of unknown function (DUF6011)
MSTDHHEEEIKVTMTMSRAELLAAMSANKPAPRSTTQQSAAAGSKFARPDFDQQQAAVRPAGQPATEKQFNFIRKLLAERVGITEAEDIRNALNDARSRGIFDKAMASSYIDRLLAIKPNPAEPTSHIDGGPLMPSYEDQKAASASRSGDEGWKRPGAVPDGQYAIKGDDEVIRFYSVNTNDGICWVAQHASDDRFNVKGRSRHQILDAIARNPLAAAVLFGHETNHCGRCGKELTREESRAAGIGPVCAKKAGWS